MNRIVKRTLCLLLSLVLLLQAAPVTTASAVPVRLAEVEIPADVLTNDVFYLASTNAAVYEGKNENYLLRVGRGGSAATESSVLIKISDVTSNYGRDYTVSVQDGSAEVHVPEDNPSLMDRILGQPFTVTELKDEESAEAAIADDPEAKTAAAEGLKSILDYLGDAAGLGKTVSAADELNPIEQARNLYTGVDGGTQTVTTTQDMMQQLQGLANVMTSVVPGADVTLTFAPGEKEKYLVITPKDNGDGDGDRYFYVILSETSGTTTNSAVSSCAVTIYDDEEQTASVVSFSESSFSAIQDGKVTVTVKRDGALNTVATATVKTVGGTAQAGRDYSAMDRQILFPFGVSEVPVEIPVSTANFDGKADFTLELTAGAGCTVAENGTAEVTLLGDKAEQRNAAGTGLQNDVVQSLITVRTDGEISIMNKWDAGNEDNEFEGTNGYDSSTDSWRMQWKGDDEKGTVGAIWKLTDEEDPFWYSGVRVKWEHDGSDATIIATVFGHHSYFSAEFVDDVEYYPSIEDYLRDWGGRGTMIEADGKQIYSYRAKLQFGETTVDLYPSNHVHETAMGSYYSNTLMTDLEAATYVAFYNRGNCDDCDNLYIKSLEPILRPFRVSLMQPDTMQFLQADGSYRSDGGIATAASIKDSVNGTLVAFLDDSVTVLQPAAANTDRYAALTGLIYYPGGDSYRSFPVAATANQGNDASANLTVTLNKDMLRSMFSMGVRSPLFRKNDELLNVYKAGNTASFYTGSYNWNCPTFGDIYLKPQFEYIDAQVTLENPYEFPIAITISGTDYWLEPHDVIEMEGIHLGDTLAISDLQLYPDEEEMYCGVGVNVEYNYDAASGGYRDEMKRFNDNNMIYIGSGKDHRLDCRDVVIRPSVTSSDIKIVIRVKTDDLANFDPDGFMTAAGTVNGEYTEFL